MAVIETWFNQDLQKPVKVQYLDGSMFSNNGNGNRIGVNVYDNGEAVTLTGSVSGYAVLSDGTTVPCTGARSGNKASILVPPAAYIPGALFLSIFLTDGTTVTTLAAVSTSVLLARTDSQVAPGTVVADWTQTINGAMQDVQTAAENLGQIVATPYASLTYPVPLGEYTYYNGNLYRCVSPIASSENFTPAHWSAAINLGDEVSNLKSAIGTYNKLYSTVPFSRKKDTTSGNSLRIGIRRNGTHIVIDGDTKDVDESVLRAIVKLNGEVETTVVSATVESWSTDMVQMQNGHLYNAELKQVGGLVDTTYIDTSVSQYPVVVSFYKNGSSVSIGGYKTSGTPAYNFSRYVLSDGSAINLCLLIPKGVIFADAEFELTFEDVDAEIESSGTNIVTDMGFTDGQNVSGDGRIISQSNRIVNNDYIQLGKGSVIYATGFSFAIASYDSNLKYINTTGWISDKIKVNNDCFARIVAQGNDSTAFKNKLRILYAEPIDIKYKSFCLDGMYIPDTDMIYADNILNGMLFEYGFISTTGEKTLNNYTIRTRNMIPVENSMLVLDFTKYDSYPVGRYVFYKSDKTFDSYNNIGSKAIYEISVPTTAKYVMISLADNWSSSPTEIGYEKKARVYFRAVDSYEKIYSERISEVVQDYKEESETGQIGYIWISDLHLKTTQSTFTNEVLPRQLKAVKETAERANLDFICIGGDVIDAEQSLENAYSLLNKPIKEIADCRVPVIWLFGNHDSNQYGTGTITKSKAMALFPENSEFYNSIVFSDEHNGSFYFDIKKKNTRIVCLNSADAPNQNYPNAKPTNWWSYSQEQIEWFCSEALKTDNNIIILTHSPSQYDINSWDHGNDGGYSTDFNNVITAYNSTPKHPITLYGHTYDFTGVDGKILYVHSGHTHWEYDQTIKEVKSGSVPCVVTGCAKQWDQGIKSFETAVDSDNGIYTIATEEDRVAAHMNSYGYQYYHWSDRTAGTIKESLFDVVSAKEDEVKCFRIGAGKDRVYDLT